MSPDQSPHHHKVSTAKDLPAVIQGGMGVAVSRWTLAREVALAGGMGTVSGTAIALVVARGLQDGDPGGHLRRALAAFPIPGVADRILDRYFVEGGKPAGSSYKAVPTWTVEPRPPLHELTVASSFAEVWLAKEGHDGPIAVNLLHDVRLPTASSLYGAVLADVDAVAMGAGIPRDIPGMLNRLAAHEKIEMPVKVENDKGADVVYRFDPHALWEGASDGPVDLRRPPFLAIVSSATLAMALSREEATRPDGLIVEAHIAGGHNAPPRGRMKLDESGQPVYGPKDDPQLEKIAEVGLPFWLAGGQGRPGAVADARRIGAAGVQVGTAFALARESGMAPALRHSLLRQVREGTASVRTDPVASPTGFPFKIAEVEGTTSDHQVYEDRGRICDLGFLTKTYRREDGGLGQRCPSEPVDDYVRKGGKKENTEGRMCLCNGLMTTAGFGQVRRGVAEPPVVTAGDDLAAASRFLPDGAEEYGAAQVVEGLMA